MKHAFLALLAGASLIAAGGAPAADAKAAEQLAKKSLCTACHAINKKMVGPGFNEIAAKYRGQKDAEAMLITKVKKGGKGVWGPVPMPPNPGVKDEDVKTLVQWVLSIK
jgi:cytochrome c